MASDLAMFVGQILRKPKSISAMAPSSRALARAITEGIGPETGAVAEFGPGTGVFTRALLARGVAPAGLTLPRLRDRACEPDSDSVQPR